MGTYAKAPMARILAADHAKGRGEITEEEAERRINEVCAEMIRSSRKQSRRL